MSYLIGVQARSGSTRLPGKIYKQVGDRSMLERVYKNCLFAHDEAVVKILGPKNDDELKSFCGAKGMTLVQPDCPEDDLIKRYVDASLGFEYVVRITSDCPMIDPSVIRQCMNYLDEYHYVSNTIWRTFPDGLDVQCCSVKFLNYIDSIQVEMREHPFKLWDENAIIRDNSSWKWKNVENDMNIATLKLSVDTEEDLYRVRKFVEGSSEQGLSARL